MPSHASPQPRADRGAVVSTFTLAVALIAVGGCGSSAAGGGGVETGGGGGLRNQGDAVLHDAAPAFGNLDASNSGSSSGAASVDGGSAADSANPGGGDSAGSGGGTHPGADAGASGDGEGDATDVGALDCPGGLGCPCDVAKDCKSKVCVLVDSAKICVPECAPTTPAEEACDGQDNNCNGETDEGDLCGDGDVCTKNICAEGKCTYPPISCDDNNACTKDSCDANTGCANAPDATLCDDNNACTVDACDPAKGCVTEAKTCDDGDGCTTDACDLAVGCTATAKSCDDGNPCTEHSCIPATGACDHGPAGNGTACDDGDLCTTGDGCLNGSCAPGQPKSCDSGSDCIVSACDKASGECGNTMKADGTDCDDKSKCTDKDSCAGGGCNGSKILCNDGKPCTVDSCDPATGCTFKPGNIGAPCNDNDACTSGDACAAEGTGVTCQGTNAKKCDDGKPCTADSCNTLTGQCLFGPAKAGTPCNDGSLCTLSDKCVTTGGKTVCQGSPIPCKDNNPCTADGCDPKDGSCVFKPQNTGSACDDGDPCTTGEKCAAVGGKGACTGGKPKSCNDNNACTADSCDAKTGKCVNIGASNGVKCDDGSKCTSGDTCSGGQCAGQPKSCDDGNFCTDDSCVASTGACAHKAVSGCDPTSCNAWSHTYGNEEEDPKYSTSTEYLYGVARNPKGGSVAAGYVYTGTASAYQGLLVRRTDDGTKSWAKHFGGKSNEFLRGVITLSDGSAIAVGNATPNTGSYYDGWAVRVSNSGSQLWSKKYGGSYYDYFFDVAPRGSGAVLCGYKRTSSSAQYRPWIVQIDSAGNPTGLKERTVSVSGTDHIYIYGCDVDAGSGMVLLAGHRYITGKSNEGFLATISSSGATTSMTVAGGSSSDSLRDVVSLGNGWLAAVGSKYSTTTYNDGWLVRTTLSLSGLAQWTYNSSGKVHDYFWGATQLSTGKIAAAGYRGDGASGSVDGWVAQLDAMTGKISGYNVKHGTTKSDYLYAVAADTAGHVLAAGRSDGGGNGDTWQVRLAPDGADNCAASCGLYDVRYGNEEDNPKYTTSSEYLYAVQAAQSGGGSLASGNVYTGPAQGTNALVVRRDAKGALKWAKQFHKGSSDTADGMVAMSDGGGVFAGSTNSTYRDGWLVRFDANGGQKWSKTYGSSYYDYLYDVAANGTGVVACGYRRSSSSAKYRPWVLWLDGNGNKTGLGERNLSMSGDHAYIYGCDVDPKDGTVYLAGHQYVSGKSNEGLLARITKTGSTKTVLRTGGTSSDSLRDVVVLGNGYVAAVGSSYTSSTAWTDGWLVRANTSLTLLASWSYGSINQKHDYFRAIAKESSSKVTVAGYYGNGSGGGNDGWLMQLNPMTGAKAGFDVKHGSAKSDYLHAVAYAGGGKWLAAGQSYGGDNGDTWQLQVDNAGKSSCGAAGQCKYWDQKAAIAYPTSTSYRSLEYTWDIEATKDGVLQVGYAQAPSQGYQGFAHKRDRYGTVQWTQMYGGTSSDYLRGGAINPDGTAWLAGYTYTNSQGSADGWLLRVDSKGKVLKEIRHGGSKYDAFYAADSDEKGGVVTAGYRDLGTGSSNDGWITWRDANGNLTSWKEKIFGGSGNQYLFGVDFDPKSGQVFAAGYKYVSGKSNEGWLVRVLTGGTSVKSLTWTGTGAEVFYGVQVHPKYGYVFAAGYSTSATAGGADGFVVRASNSFTGATQKLIGTSKSEYLYDITMSSTGDNLAAVGYIYDDGKASNAGWLREISWSSLAPTGLDKRYGVKGASDYFYAVATTPDGYAIGGRSGAKSNDYDTWTLSVDPAGAAMCK